MGRMSRTLRHVPRLPPGAVERPRLLARLDGPAPLVVVRGRGGTGKTTLLAQWVLGRARTGDGALLWVDADEGARSRTGFWVRVLGRMHAQHLIDDAELYHETAAVADRPASVVPTLVRLLGSRPEELTLVLDDVGAPGPGSWWEPVCADLLELLRRAPQVRCVAAGRARTALESVAARTAVAVEVLDDEALALDDEELRRLAEATAPGLPAELARALAERREGPGTRRAATVRSALDALREAPQLHDLAHLPRIDQLLLEAERRELQREVPDPSLHAFLLEAARSPLLDAPLAARLSGRADAAALLDALAVAGLGHWEEDAEAAAPVLRVDAAVRATVLALAPRTEDARTRRLHGEIARWLGGLPGERLAALEHALHAEDLALAERLLLRACPLGAEDSAHVTALLREVPAVAIHAHPVLALWFGISLHRDPRTRDRAAPFLRSATALGRSACAPMPPAEQAVRRAVEGIAHRLLGRHERMLEIARSCLPALEQAMEDPDRDRDLDAPALVAIDQCALGLFLADDHDGARRARRLQLSLAERQDRRPLRNAALAHLALIDAATGEIAEAGEDLARIRPEDWPEAWRRSSADSPERIARAWVLLCSGRAREALAQLEGPAQEGEEHADLAAAAEALALVMLGRPHDAVLRFSRTSGVLRDARTLPSARRRTQLASDLLQMAVGGPPAPLRRGTARPEAGACALAALAALAAGDPGGAVVQAGEAALAATTPLQRMIVAAATTVLAADPACELDLDEAVLRMTAILRDTGATWPVILLPARVRRRALEVESARDVLAATFAVIPPMPPGPAAGMRTVPRLTAREQEILALLPETDGRTEIARRLFVSVNTVKTQLRGLYGKLDAGTREQAISRAIDLGLLRPSAADGTAPVPADPARPSTGASPSPRPWQVTR